MSNYPQQFDDDSTIFPINDNLSEIGGDSINQLRDAVFNIEQTLGVNIAGSTPSLAQRLGVFINPDGSPNTSVLFSLGLVTLPVTNNQIADNADIPESKLHLDFRTQDLFNYIRDLSRDVNIALGWIAVSGVKLEPHIAGTLYRHNLSHIDVAGTSAQFLNSVFRTFRDNTNAYTLINDINNELLDHQWADGSPFGVIRNIITNSGATYPSNYAHVASGIFLNTSRFAVIPQTAQDMQAFADFIDGSSILTLGTRIQNLYHNGISRNSRSSSLTTDGYGQPLVPVTPATAFLRGHGNASFPTDDIAIGDDIVQFFPSSSSQSNNTFDEQFALVRAGDIIRINYAADGYNVEVPFIISEKKYIQGGGNKIYLVRIAGKNIAYSPNAVARIDRDLFNNNKAGVLASAMGIPLNATGSSLLGGNISPSLIVGTPRGAQALGVGFSPDQFDEKHYVLYLALYTTGNPLDGYTFLPGIDVTGNQGTTPGAYTLDSIVAATNNVFRQPGLNYRFIAFQYNGEFGIMLADSYNNASFSVVSGVVSGSGVFDQVGTQLHFPNNVVDVFPLTGIVALDPLGFGPFGAGIASPPFLTTYGSTAAANFPTLIFPPLRRNNYYVNGNERERLTLDVGQALDVYGDGYWIAIIDGYSNNAGPPGHTTVTYNISLDLSSSGLKAGKTLVVQPFATNFGLVNYGRFVIQSVNFTCCPPVHTQITVFDAVHAVGASPSPVAPVGSQVSIYFNSDSVSFDNETATDFSPVSVPFKRFFETYIDQGGNTFTHERGRISTAGTTTINGVPLYNSFANLGQMDIVNISPKLRGYQFGTVNKINLRITSFNATTGAYVGNLASFDGFVFTRPGTTTTGKVGEVTRFYDETNLDYIDIVFNVTNTVPTFTNQYIDFQLFPTLSLDEEIMLISTCQINSSTGQVSQIKDRRQFGNTSEEELTTSALDFISLPDKLLHFNGVVRGFDASATSQYGTSGFISLTGGLALNDGNLISVNDEIFTIPAIREYFNSVFYPINYALCVNSAGDLVTIVLTDFDATLNTPVNATGRVVTVNNVVSSTTYQVDSNTFSYILNNRKDLTVLYIVSATTTGTGTGATTALSIRDVRRFINDSDASIPAVLTSDNSQGNFKTLDASLNWLKFNSAFQNVLEVKGSFMLTSDPGFNFPLEIVGNGANATIEFTSEVDISNVTFRRLTLLFDGYVTATNVIFDDCTITFGAASTLTNVTIDPSIVTVNDTLTVSQLSVSNSTIHVPVLLGFNLGNDVSFIDCTFNYTAVTFSNIHPISYQTTNLVNANMGMIYAAVGATLLTNITIKGCIFNNTLSDHFPFISLQLTDFAAIVQNVNISNNQFIAHTTLDDKRAVISFTSTLPTADIGGSPAPPSGFAILAGSGITNTGGTTILGDIGTFPTTTETGFPPGVIVGTNHAGDAVTQAAKTALTAQYLTAAALTPTATIPTDLNGQTLSPGVYNSLSGTFMNTGTVTLDGGGNPNATWTFQMASTLVTASSSNVVLINSAQATNVTWQVGSSATLGTSSHLEGSILALTSITATTSATVNGRLLARNGAVTLDTNTVVVPAGPILLGDTVSKFPRMVNVVVDQNMCNYDQMILISIDSNDRSTLVPIVGAMIDTVNCKISNNVCGTIGYLTSGGSPAHADNATINLAGVPGIRDKTSGLVIQNNTCKLITNLDGVGAYVPFRAIAFPSIGNVNTDYVRTGTGACAILNNTASWIQVGCTTYNKPNSYGLIISGNNVSPSDPAFLTSFTDNVISNVPISNVGILLRRGNIAGVIDTIHSIISDNNIMQTKFYETNGSATPLFYYDAAIVCFNNANITNNVVNGVINSSSAPILYLWGENFSQGPTLLVKNNTFIRKGLNIQAYVVGQASVTGPLPNIVSIVGNIFDSPFIDAGNTVQLSGLNIPNTWAFYGNTNQTVEIALSPTEFANYIYRHDLGGNTHSSTSDGAAPADTILADLTDKFSVSRFIPVIGTPSSPDAQYVIVADYDCTVGPRERNYSFTVPLDYVLPPGVKIISASMGIWIRENSNTLDTNPVLNQATLTLLSFNPTATSNSVNGIVDVMNNLTFTFSSQTDNSINGAATLQSSLSVGTGGSVTEASLISSTQYLTITPTQTTSVQNSYTTGAGHRIAATFDLNYLRSTTVAGFIKWYLSPIVVTYRW